MRVPASRLIRQGMNTSRALMSQQDKIWSRYSQDKVDIGETLAHVLRTLQKEHGMAVLLVEHDLTMVGAVVDRTIVMDLGSRVAEGTFDEVMADPRVRDAYLGTNE